MATNNIKIFDQNKTNMLTDEAYNTSTQRLNGVQQGIASSQLQNKTLYQVSLVAYAIGQMMQANGLNANDADAVSTFAGNLSNTIVQKILDKASTVEAKNFTVNNKFITPQTWKAAYDFMKADSNMVTSAVDDTHYITPKLLKEGAEKYGGYTYVNGVLSKFEPQLRMPYIPVVYENQNIIQAYMSPDMKKMLVSGTCINNYVSGNFFFAYDIEKDEVICKDFDLHKNHIVAYDNTHVVLLKYNNGDTVSIYSYNTENLVKELDISSQGIPRNSRNCIGYCYHDDIYFLFAYDIESGYTTGQTYFNIVLYNKQTKTAKNNKFTARGYTSFSIGMSPAGVLILERYYSNSEVNLIRENNGEMQSFSYTFTNFYRLSLAGFVGNFAYFLGNTGSSSDKTLEKYDISNLAFDSHSTVMSGLSRYTYNVATLSNCFVVKYSDSTIVFSYFDESLGDSFFTVRMNTFFSIDNIAGSETSNKVVIKNLAGIAKDIAVIYTNQPSIIKQIDCYSGVFKKLT